MAKRSLRTERKRRMEGKTDYKLRFGLLKSGKKRVVIRRSNKYFTVQLVESKESKDKVIFGVSSRDLLKSGWSEKNKGSLKSIPAGYLTGLLFAKKAKELKVDKEEIIIDLGMRRKIYGNRSYSVVKGLAEGGLNIKVDEKIFPSEERLGGQHLKEGLSDIIKKVKGGLN